MQGTTPPNSVTLAPEVPRPRPDTSGPQSPGPDPESFTLPPTLAATYQHCLLLQQKVEALHARLVEGREQLFFAVAREYASGRLTQAQLAQVYEYARNNLGSGVMTQWDGLVPIGGRSLAARHHVAVRNAPNSHNGTFWTGEHPYGTPVVYVLYDAGCMPVYLGSTQHLRYRIKQHVKNGIPVAFWLACPAESREAAYLREDALLKDRKPPMNKRAGR